MRESSVVANAKKEKRILLGLGFDHEDGHKRITHGEDFYIAGGSQETHERMTETTLKTVEDLRQRGKTFATAGFKELAEILHKNRPKE